MFYSLRVHQGEKSNQSKVIQEKTTVNSEIRSVSVIDQSDHSH